MSREHFVRPISKQQYRSLFATPTQAPRERLSEIHDSTSPAASLQGRSILAEFNDAGGDIFGTKQKDLSGLGHHQLVAKIREAKHILSDLANMDLPVSNAKYTQRI